MIKTVKGYTFDSKESHDASNGTWYPAEKDGEKYFLKRLKEPKYPYTEGTDPDGSQKAKCEEWYAYRLRVLEALRQLGNGTGNCVFPKEMFREKALYYMVSYWVAIQAKSVEEIAKLTDSDKLFILRTYCATLNRVHRVNIIHGDIKPENVPIGKSAGGRYVAKLIDFDDSYFSSDPLSPGLTKATEEYKSPELAAYVVTDPSKDPEQYRELRSRLTCAVDVFASGLMFHEFWTGKQPEYAGASPEKPFYKAVIGREKYKYDSRIPGWLTSLIDDMLQREPEKRPTMNEVLEAIKAESYEKKNAWQSEGGDTAPVAEKPKVDFSRLKELLGAIPNNLEVLEPKSAVKKINMICDFIKQNIGSMHQEQVDVLAQRLGAEIKNLRREKTHSPSGKPTVVSPLPNGVKSAEIITENLVKVIMDGNKTLFKTKDQAYKMGVITIS